MIKYFEKELTKLKSNLDIDINKEKSAWIKIANDMKKEELLDDENMQEFKSKIDNVDNLSRLMIALQWLGCVLSTIILLPFMFDRIKNRIFYPKNTRILKRLQDSTIPLQKTINSKDKNQIR